MLTFEKWLDEWKIDSDYEPTEKEVDAMRDAWDGAIQTMREAAQQSVESDVVSPAKGKEYLAEMNKVASELLRLLAKEI